MPSVNKIVVSNVLTDILVGYGKQGFVADQVAPSTIVKQKASVIFQGGKEKLKDHDSERKSGARTARVDFDYSSTTYKTVRYGLHTTLDSDAVDNVEQPIDLEADATVILSSILLLGHEKRVKAISQAAVTGVPAVVAWDAPNADPKKNVDGVKRTVRQNKGQFPNSILLSCAVRDALVNYLLGKAQITYGEAARVVELPPLLWDMKPVVPLVVENTANLGAAEDLADVWGNDPMVYIAGSPSIIYTGAFLTLRRNLIGPQGYRVRRWFDEETESTYVESQSEEDEVAVDLAAARKLTGVLS